MVGRNRSLFAQDLDETQVGIAYNKCHRQSTALLSKGHRVSCSSLTLYPQDTLHMRHHPLTRGQYYTVNIWYPQVSPNIEEFQTVVLQRASKQLAVVQVKVQYRSAQVFALYRKQNHPSYCLKCEQIRSSTVLPLQAQVQLLRSTMDLGRRPVIQHFQTIL